MMVKNGNTHGQLVAESLQRGASQRYLEGMANQVPEDFLFGLTVTDAITIKKFPGLDHFGGLAGTWP
jgi:hypothetical protein